MKSSLLLLCSTALLSVAGCFRAVNEPQPPPYAGVIVPLAVGNMWIGMVTEYDSAGNASRATLDTIAIGRDTVVGGERRYLDGPDHGYVNRKDGLYEWDLASSEDPKLMYRFPAMPGQQVQVFGRDGNRKDTTTITVIGVNVAAHVPAGIFVCNHYLVKSNHGKFDIHWYIAANVGFVKIKHVDRLEGPDRVGWLFWELSDLMLR